MALKLDSRQTRQRSKLDQLSTTTDLRLDAIMNLINDELTMPLRMRSNERYAFSTDVDNQRLYIDGISVKTFDTGATDNGHDRSRTIPPIGGVLPDYSGGGHILFPTSSGGSITGSGLTLDKPYTLTIPSGQFVKVLVWLSATTQSSFVFGMEIGAAAATSALAILPAPPTDAFALGYVVMSNSGGVISTVSNANIFQFAGGGGAGGGSGASKEITQANSFAPGDVVYYTGSTYAKAQADTAAKAEAIGMVSKASSTKFTLTELGYVSGLSGLVAGEVYYLSATVEGALTATEPNVIGQISKPMFIADSTTSGYVLNYRGVVVGGANARSKVNLTNNGITNVQSVIGYEAAELQGWVYINASTPYRFYITIQFSQNGAGSDYNVSYQTSGDTPPAGFSVSYASNNVRMTLPLLAGFASAAFDYSLNGPAVGVTFPLSIDAGTIASGTVNAARLPVVVPGTSAGVVSASGLPGNTTGNAIASGYVGEVTTAVSTASAQSNGAWRTGTKITLQPGVYLIRVKAVGGTTAPKSLGVGITTTANSAPVADVTGFVTAVNVSDTANTSNTLEATTFGYFRPAATTDYYPTIQIYSPVASNYTFDWYIQAIRIA